MQDLALASATLSPVVSVVMTTYRDESAVLKAAIDSILAQTFRDLELIIVFEPDDQNYDLMVREYHDPRVAAMRCDTVTGRAGSFNVALSAARGRYIARMDSDDVAYPMRLAKQVAFLRAHRDVAMIGASARLVDRQQNRVGIRRFPTDPETIARRIAMTNPFLHPTILWDREKVGYDLRYDLDAGQEDTALWLRMLVQGHKLANLPDIVLDYRQPDGYRRPVENWRCGLRVRCRHWRLGLRYPFFFVGIAFWAVLVCLPKPAIDLITQRNWLSDRLRSIRNEGAPTELN